MKKLITILGILVFIVGLFLPGIQMLTKKFPETKLEGEIILAKMPHVCDDPINCVQFRDTTAQSYFGTWFHDHIGFKAAAIKTHNQINFSVFKELTENKNTPLVLGKNNMLYEKGYIDAYNNYTWLKDEYIKTKVLQLEIFQKELEKRGVNFLLVVAPNKAEIYPEFIPKKHLDKNRIRQVSNYLRTKKYLDKYGIRYVDGKEFAVREKEKNEYSLFANGGTHWNYYTALKVTQMIIEALENQSGKDYVNVKLDEVIVDNKPHGYDKDIANLLNIWDESATNGPTPHPIFSSDETGGEEKPNILIVGDSFSWVMMEIMNDIFYDERDFYYYFSRNKHFPSGNFKEIDKTNFDWEKEVFSRDVVILEMVENGINTAWYGFVEEALEYLDKS